MVKRVKSRKRPNKAKGKEHLKNETYPDLGFKQFFSEILEKPPTEAERDKAHKRVRAEMEAVLKNPNSDLSSIRKLYDKTASLYVKCIQPVVLDYGIKTFNRYASLKRADKIASIGSGPGIMECFIAKRLVPDGSVTCVDISPEMNKIAEQVKQKAGANNMRAITASGAKTGLPSNSQDKVLISQTNLVGTRHLFPMLVECRRIIEKSRGARIAVSFSPTVSKKQKVAKELNTALGRCGFEPLVTIRYAQSGNRLALMTIAKPILIGKR